MRFGHLDQRRVLFVVEDFHALYIAIDACANGFVGTPRMGGGENVR